MCWPTPGDDVGNPYTLSRSEGSVPPTHDHVTLSRSEGSVSIGVELLRCAQHDSPVILPPVPLHGLG
jgi:hypothetical protein